MATAAIQSSQRGASGGCAAPQRERPTREGRTRKRRSTGLRSYTLSMIPDWQSALRDGAGKLVPLGQPAIIDFGQQERLPRWCRALLSAWLGKVEVAPRVLRLIAGMRG